MTILVKPEEVPQNLICCICLEVPTTEPSILKPCSHIFCRNCIETSITIHNKYYDHKTCPTCRCKIGKRDLLKLESNPSLYQQWSRIPARCQYYRPTTEGCNWIGSLGDYESHTKSCRYHVIPSLREENERLKLRIETAELRQKSHAEEVRRLRSQNEGLEYRLTSSGIEREELKQRIERLSSLNTSKKDLEARVRELKKELLQGTNENKNLREKIAAELSNTMVVKEELKKAMELFSNAKNKIKLLTTEKHGVNQIISVLMNAKKNLQIRVQKLESDLQEKTVENDILHCRGAEYVVVKRLLDIERLNAARLLNAERVNAEHEIEDLKAINIEMNRRLLHFMGDKNNAALENVSSARKRKV